MALLHLHEAKGIDVSSNNHTSGSPWDWVKVKDAGIDFVYVKATQGIDYVNEYMLGDVRAAFDHSLEVGIYHYANTDNPKAEAEWFFHNGITQVLEKVGDVLTLHPVIDFETPDPSARWVAIFLSRLNELYKPLGAQYMDRSYLGAVGARGKFTWLAWPGGTYKDDTPEGVLVVQYGQEIVAGIEATMVDVNHAFDLRAIKIGAEIPVTTPAIPRDNKPPSVATAPTSEPTPEPASPPEAQKLPIMIVNLFDDNTYSLIVKRPDVDKEAEQTGA